MTPTRQQLLQAIAEMWELYPNWRLGQMVQNAALWARQPIEPVDPTWDVEDEELLSTLRGHIERRHRVLSEDANVPVASETDETVTPSK